MKKICMSMFALMSVSACVTDEGDELALDSTTQAVTWQSYDVYTNQTINTYLPASEWSCFLAGVWGDISSGVGWSGNSGIQTYIDDATNTWKARAHGGYDQFGNALNNHVSGRINCLHSPPLSYNSWIQHYFADNAPAKDLGVADGRQCMLTEVFGVEGAWDYRTSSMLVSVVPQYRGLPRWQINGTVAGGNAGYAGGAAVCFDPNGWADADSATAQDPGSITKYLSYGAANVTCGFSRIQGHLDQSAGVDGAYITFNSGTISVTATNGKSVGTTCFQ